MSGSPDNARQWADADVYVAFDPGGGLDAVTSPATVDDPFGADWDLVGLLNGEDGFTESRDEDTEDHYAWGGVLVRTSRRNFKLTRTFTALEDNAVTFRLRWPGSTSGGDIVAPSGNRIERVKVAFETRDGDTVRRLITKHEAEITVDGDVNENESDISSVPFLVTVYPDGDGVLFAEQTSEALASA